MLNLDEFRNTPMCNALTDLANELQSRNLPPVELNVIGGFALMLRGVRNPSDITDIDYVGTDLYEKFNAISNQIGLKHGMEQGWINNDGMLTGDSMEDFELSTGKLHFDHAFTIGNISINVLTERDLLRMKLIAIDTAMTEMEATGEFARRKDFADIKALMELQNLTPEKVEEEFGEYILCESDTLDLVTIIYKKGHEMAMSAIDKKSEEIKTEQQLYQTKKRSPYMENLMEQLMRRRDQIQLEESDLDFAVDENLRIL